MFFMMDDYDTFFKGQLQKILFKKNAVLLNFLFINESWIQRFLKDHMTLKPRVMTSKHSTVASQDQYV